MVTSALQSFLDVRTAPAAREFAVRGLAGCRQLSDVLDEAIRSLSAPVMRPGLALAAVGGYGRREQYRFSEIDLLFLGVDEAAEVAPAILHPLWDAGLRVRYSVRSVEHATRAGREDVDTLIGYLDTRFLGGDDDVYRRFVEQRQRLVRRGRRAIKEALALRHHALVEAEPWQLVEPDIFASRGGLAELHAVRWLELADAIAERRGQRPPGDPFGPLAAEHETLAQVRAAIHALEDEPNDHWRPDAAIAVGDLIDVDPVLVNRRLMASMRRVDDAVSAAAGQPSRSRFARWGRMLLPPPAPAARPTQRITDLDRLLTALRNVAPGVLEPLPRTEWLDRVLPEWEALRGLAHTAPFHQHPVDIHAIRTVVEARRAMLEDADAMGTALVAREIASEDELLLAALVHEMGQGHPSADRGAGGILAERFASRVGFDAETAQRIANVAEHHMLLPTVASRRDISEPKVIAEVADTVGDPATLHLLYLIAVADARATGPDAWSAWKAALMRTLYVRVLEHLRDGAPAVASATATRREAVLHALEGRFPREAIEAHLDSLPPRYLLAIRPETVGEHMALIEYAAGGTATRHDRVGEMERLTIVTPDRSGILSAVAGVLAVDDVNVLGGNAYTRTDGTAIEIFHVADALGYGIDDLRWVRISEDITQALAGKFRIQERLHAARQARTHIARSNSDPLVHVDNSGPDGFSVIEVNAADRVGLLYAITNALHELGLDIHLAKVDTFGQEVADAFYVLRENGRRIEDEDEVERVRRRIIEAVTALDI